MKDTAYGTGAGRTGSSRSTPIARSANLIAWSSQAVLAVAAVSLLSVAPDAASAAVPEGFALLRSGMDIASARVLADGTLVVTLVDGTARIFDADAFVILENGTVAVPEAAAAELLALAETGLGVGAAGAPGGESPRVCRRPST